MEYDSEIRARLTELEAEHRALDGAIEAMQARPSPDFLEIRRLKKRKLQLKDSIQRLRSRLIPDLNA
ncbi:YdcH family protein [Thioalkalivibrio sp. ALJ24]|uniref:YdcH family protein n=1 Tax=Thioalkalivibrio sp. ALJ24 TaxID=545276 RepID=UPI000369B015|nr:YdcH family protein [Thioalkalivibrio sp. ALJ24]